MAQTQITDARTALQEAKDSLSNKRSDLVQLWTRNQTVEEMIRILDQMCVYLAYVFVRQQGVYLLRFCVQ